jgi:hypothetical protein
MAPGELAFTASCDKTAISGRAIMARRSKVFLIDEWFYKCQIYTINIFKTTPGKLFPMSGF